MNVAWAEEAVRKSLSATEQEAVKLKIINMVAENIPALLKQLNGRTIPRATGPITFSNEAVTLREFPMGTRLEYERLVVFFLGTFQMVKGPGIRLVVPALQQMVRVNLQTVTMEVPSQDVITRDNISVKVNAVIFLRVVDPQRAVLAAQDYLYSTSQVAQTTLRSVLGQSQFDDLLSKRDDINAALRRIIDQQTEP
jgi:hypothetical protein